MADTKKELSAETRERMEKAALYAQQNPKEFVDALTAVVTELTATAGA